MVDLIDWRLIGDLCIFSKSVTLQLRYIHSWVAKPVLCLEICMPKSNSIMTLKSRFERGIPGKGRLWKADPNDLARVSTDYKLRGNNYSKWLNIIYTIRLKFWTKQQYGHEKNWNHMAIYWKSKILLSIMITPSPLTTHSETY